MAKTLDCEWGVEKMIPRQKYRYLLSIDGVDGFEIQLDTKPSSYQTRMKLREAISPNGAFAIIKWIQTANEGNFSLADPNLAIKQVDSMGTVMAIWEFKQPLLVEMVLDPVELPEITIKYKEAVFLF